MAVVAGVVGAGFASGREAAVFFAPYGGWGTAGIGLTVLLVGRAASRPTRSLSVPFGSVWCLLVWATLATTLAAGGEILRQLLGWPVVRGSAALALLAAAAPGGTGTRRWQGVTVLLLTGAILLVGGAAWRHGGLLNQTTPGRWAALPGIASVGEAGWPGAAPAWAPRVLRGVEGRGGGRAPLTALTMALLYASYTSALVMGGLGPGPGDRRAPSWLGAALVGALLVVMAGALRRWEEAGRAPLPMLAVAAGWSGGAAQAYAWLLWVAAANSAVANARALAERLAALPGGPAVARAGVTLLAWASSSLGFATLVGTVYPLLGWAWLPVVLGLAGDGGPRRPCCPRERGI